MQNDLKIKFQFSNDIKQGKYSSKYFLITKKIISNNKNSHDVTLKFFQFNNNVVVCGVNESIQLIKFSIGKNDLKNIQIFGKKDGEIVKKNEPILLIRGDYKKFCHLENIIDGILSRRSSISTNCKNIIDLISNEKIIYMADRSDDYSMQPYDGYAAYYGGIRKFVTKKHIDFLKKTDVEYIGTIPHAMIQQFKGNIVDTINAFKKKYPKHLVTALIDYNNDCLQEIENLHKNNIKVDFVRIDTSSKNIDNCLKKEAKKNKNNKKYYGVNHFLIKKVRIKLDELNMKETKIIVSSGIDIKKIKDYIKKKTAIDIYGIGKSFLNINIHFTGDLIKIGDEYQAKFGRKQNIEKYYNNLTKYN